MGEIVLCELLYFKCGVSSSILIIFVPLKTGMNIPQLIILIYLLIQWLDDVVIATSNFTEIYFLELRIRINF